jgi:hypothetical protein
MDEVLRNVTNILEKRLVMTRLDSTGKPDKTKLIFRNGFGYTDVQSQVYGKQSLIWTNPVKRCVCPMFSVNRSHS